MRRMLTVPKCIFVVKAQPSTLGDSSFFSFGHVHIHFPCFLEIALFTIQLLLWKTSPKPKS